MHPKRPDQKGDDCSAPQKRLGSMTDHASVETVLSAEIAAFLAESPWQTALTSHDGIILALSQPLRDLLNDPSEAYLGQPIETLVLEKEQSNIRSLFEQLQRGTVPPALRAHLLRRNHFVVAVELELFPIVGDPARRVTVVVYPISMMHRRERIILEFNRLVPRLLEAQSAVELYDKAAQALQPLGMGILVAALEPGQESLRIEYLSLKSGLLDVLYRIAKLDLDRLRISRTAPFFSQVLERREALFANDFRRLFQAVVSQHAVAMYQRMVQLSGIPGFILAPLLAGKQVRGVLMVWSHVLNPEQVPFVEAFAHQLAVMLAQIELRAQMHRQMQRLNSLATTAHAVTTLGSLDDVLRVVCMQAQELLGADLARIAAPIEGTNTLKYIMSTGQDAGDLLNLAIPIDASVSGTVLRTGQGRMIADLREAREVYAPFREHSRTRSVLYQPLQHQAIVLGVLIVGHGDVGYFSQADLDYLGRYAEYAAVAIANAQLHAALQRSEDEQQRQRRELEALLNVSRAVNHSLELTTLLQEGLRVLEELDLATVSTVLLVNADASAFDLRAARGVPASVLPLIQHTALDSVSGDILRDGRPRVLSQSERKQMLEEYGIKDHFLQQTAVDIPLLVGKKRLGVLSVSRPNMHQYAEHELQLLQALANLLAQAVGRAQAYLALQDTAALNARLYRKAEEVRSYLNTLVQNTPDLLLTVRQDMTIHILNPERLTEATSYSVDQVEGQVFLRLAPEHLHTYLLQFWQHILSGRPQTFELELANPNGTPVFLMISAALIADYGEVLAIVKDVTEQRQREAHVRQNDKLAALGGMVAGAAHELNNPLATILGLAQLQLGESMPAELRADLEAIEGAALRARSIVQQLLRFASPQQPQTEPVALAPLITETLDRLKQALRASDAQIILDLAPDLPPTLGDRYQLEQVLFNIFQNAAQSLSENSPDLPRRLHIRAIRETDVLQLTIEDTGTGIPPEHLSRIFDPFFTTRQIGQGAGLGLAICHTIIQQHDGRIWVQSPPGKGATFVIQLPISHMS
jgi:PAS domain S-box-containing protein